MAETTINRTWEAIENVMAELDKETHPTLKAIAAALDVPQQRLYSVAKQPKAGEVYDANVYNWDSIDRFVTRRLDPDKGLDTHEDVIRKAYEMDEVFKSNDGRRARRGTGAKASGISMENGTVMPHRKYDLHEGDIIALKSEKLPHKYEVKLVTDTHVCVQRVGSTELNSYSNWTINQKFLVDTPEAIDDIMSERETALAEESAAATVTADVADATVAEDDIAFN